jgi:hypothetical protein
MSISRGLLPCAEWKDRTLAEHCQALFSCSGFQWRQAANCVTETIRYSAFMMRQYELVERVIVPRMQIHQPGLRIEALVDIALGGTPGGRHLQRLAIRPVAHGLRAGRGGRTRDEQLQPVRAQVILHQEGHDCPLPLHIRVDIGGGDAGALVILGLAMQIMGKKSVPGEQDLRAWGIKIDLLAQFFSTSESVNDV